MLYALLIFVAIVTTSISIYLFIRTRKILEKKNHNLFFQIYQMLEKLYVRHILE